MTATRWEMLCHGSTLPVATSLVSAWAWLYTVALPEQVRTARREEIRSDLHDQMAQDREAGVSPARTAIHILRRMALGAWDDVSWSLPHIPSALAGHLVRGSHVIGHARPSPWAIASLAVLGLMNWVLAMSDRTTPGLNGSSSMPGCGNHPAPAEGATFLGKASLPVMGRLHRHPDRRCGYLGSPDSRLLQLPLDYELLLEAILLMPLMVLGLLVATRISSAHVSEGNWWWPVLPCLPVIGLALWSSGIAVDGSPENFLEVSVATAVLSAGWIVLAAIFAYGSGVVCHAGLRGTAGCMRLLAGGIGRIG